MENKESFNYTYSAKEQDEIKAIRQKYEEKSKNEDKMTALRRLDASVTKKATVASLIFGIIGALVMGFGMSLVMEERFAEFLGIEGGTVMLVGITTGLVGMALVALAYPIYNGIVKKEREKIAPEIIRLTDELMK